jgi:hypothetical protein
MSTTCQHLTTQKGTSERGAALLLFALIMPLLLLMGGLVLDMSMMYLDRENVQQRLDEAALLSARYLPHSKFARSQAESYFHKHIKSTRADVFTATVHEDTVHLHLRRPAPSPLIGGATQFACVFAGKDGCKEKTAGKNLWFEARSVARINPKDVVLFFDNSSYLAPPISSNGGVVWAEDTRALDENGKSRYEKCIKNSNNTAAKKKKCQNGVRSVWPTADYLKADGLFKHVSHPKIAGSNVHQRILTQQCFNNIYSPMKELTIRLYDRFSANPSNQVGVMSGPGGAGRIVQIKPIASKTSNQGNFEFYRSSDTADEWCYAIAEREESHPGYQFPDSAESLGFAKKPSELLSSANGTIPANKSHQITVQEAIWSRAVQRNSGRTSKTLNIKKVILAVGNQLLGAPIQTGRGNLSDDISSTAFFILGDFPRVGGARFPEQAVKTKIGEAFGALDESARLLNRKASLYFLTTKHFGNYGKDVKPGIDCTINPGDYDPRPFPCNAFYDDSRKFAKFVSKENKKYENLEVVFFRIPDRGSLAQDFLHVIAEIDKAVVLQQ